MAAVEQWVKARHFPRQLRTSIRAYYNEVSTQLASLPARPVLASSGPALWCICLQRPSCSQIAASS